MGRIGQMRPRAAMKGTGPIAFSDLVLHWASDHTVDGGSARVKR
jgi:hypothetical protein